MNSELDEKILAEIEEKMLLLDKKINQIIIVQGWLNNFKDEIKTVPKRSYIL